MRWVRSTQAFWNRSFMTMPLLGKAGNPAATVDAVKDTCHLRARMSRGQAANSGPSLAEKHLSCPPYPALPW